MFDQNGLSLDQAPPISVILGLFLLGGIFGVVGGFSILYYGSSIFDPASTGAIVTIHIFSLGAMMSFMLGALFQMLPVIAGVVLASPIPKANLTKVLLILGLLSLVVGFISHAGFLFIFATVFLGSMLLYVSIAMMTRLIKIPNHSASSGGMLLALLSMFVFVVMALYMTTAYGQMHNGALFAQLKEVHYAYALFGWVALLIVSISFQTVEMFYVTPRYPKLLSRYMPVSIFTLILLMSVSILVDSSLTSILRVFIYLIFAAYGIMTLVRLSQRKRPLADATVWFWRIGMGSLTGSMVLLTIDTFVNQQIIFDIASVLFASFIFSVLFAMFYKIVPFLTWFHLNAQGYLTAPMMHEVIHPKTAKKHMWIHLASIASLLVGTVFTQAVYLAGLLLIVSFGWIAYQVSHAKRLYEFTQQNGEKFEF